MRSVSVNQGYHLSWIDVTILSPTPELAFILILSMEPCLLYGDFFDMLD